MTWTVENGRSRREHSPSTTLSPTNPTRIGLGVYVSVLSSPPTRCLHCEALSTDINALIRLRTIYFWDLQSVSLGITARRGPRLWTESSVNTGRSTLAWSTAWELTNPLLNTLRNDTQDLRPSTWIAYLRLQQGILRKLGMKLRIGFMWLHCGRL